MGGLPPPLSFESGLFKNVVNFTVNVINYNETRHPRQMQCLLCFILSRSFEDFEWDYEKHGISKFISYHHFIIVISVASSPPSTTNQYMRAIGGGGGGGDWMGRAEFFLSKY